MSHPLDTDAIYLCHLCDRWHYKHESLYPSCRNTVMSKKSKKSEKPEKPASPPSKFEAIVRITYGKGAKAVHVDVPATVDFKYTYNDVEEEAILVAINDNVRDKVLNLKELKTAYKAWAKAEGL